MKLPEFFNIRHFRNLVLILSVFMVGCSNTDDTRLQRFLMQGNEMVENQNYEQAIEYYQAALEIDSCFADALNNMGTVYHSQRDFARAIASYSRAISCAPGYTDAYLNRANSYYETNELFSALKDLGIVEKKQPDTVALHFLRGLALTKLRNYPLARKSFKRALELAPANRELLVNLGTVYYYEKKNDSARYFLNISEKEKEPNAYNTLALIEADMDNLKEALAYINQALEAAPEDPFFLNNRGYILLRLNDVEEALKDINHSITIDPYNGWAYRNKGIYYLMTARYDDALRMFRRAETQDKYIQDIYFYLAEAYWLKGDKDNACLNYRISNENKEGHNVPAGRCSS